MPHPQPAWEGRRSPGESRASLPGSTGKFRVRGDCVELWPSYEEFAFRIEFWGDEIVSIRSFEIMDQRSTAELTETHILPVDFRRGTDDGDDTISTSLVPARTRTDFNGRRCRPFSGGTNHSEYSRSSR